MESEGVVAVIAASLGADHHLDELSSRALWLESLSRLNQPLQPDQTKPVWVEKTTRGESSGGLPCPLHSGDKQPLSCT